jgi:hypothetical protein
MKVAVLVLLISILAWYCFSPALLSSLRESDDSVLGFLHKVRVPSLLPMNRLLNLIGPALKCAVSFYDGLTRPDQFGTHEVDGILDKVANE